MLDRLVRDGRDVFTPGKPGPGPVQAAALGRPGFGLLDRFLAMNEEKGTQFFTLRDYAHDAPAKPGVIKMGYLTGRAGKVAVQEEN